MDLLQRNQQIVDSFLNGKTNKELSILYGVGVKQINKVLRDNGVSLAQIRQLRRENIVQEFKTGIDVWALAKKYKMTPEGIWAVLKDFGIYCSDKEDRNKLIAQKYSEGYDIADLEKEFNLSTSQIRVVLREQSIECRGYTLNKKQEIYKNFNAERVVEHCPELFYWLGFIQADGSISNSGKGCIRLDIGLSILDKDHLVKFATWLGFQETNITVRKGTAGDMVRFGFSTPELFSWYAYGIIPRKTYKFIKPNIPDKYFGDYLRGLIDGDGHIHTSDGRIHIDIVNNNEYIKWLKVQLETRGIHCKELNYEGKVYSRVHIYGLSEVRKVEALCKSQSTDLKLSRKWDKLIKFKPILERCVKHELESRNAAIIADYKAGLSRNELMVKYNRSRPVICQILKDIYQNDIQQRNTKIHELRQHGLTLQQIADQYGITKQGVRVILNSATV